MGMQELIGRNIKSRRETLGLTQAELAEKVVQNAKRESYISIVESGKTVISVLRLQEFAKALLCQPADLLVAVSDEVPA